MFILPVSAPWSSCPVAFVLQTQTRWLSPFLSLVLTRSPGLWMFLFFRRQRLNNETKTTFFISRWIPIGFYLNIVSFALEKYCRFQCFQLFPYSISCRLFAKVMFSFLLWVIIIVCFINYHWYKSVLYLYLPAVN